MTNRQNHPESRWVVPRWTSFCSTNRAGSGASVAFGAGACCGSISSRAPPRGSRTAGTAGTAGKHIPTCQRISYLSKAMLKMVIFHGYAK